MVNYFYLTISNLFLFNFLEFTFEYDPSSTVSVPMNAIFRGETGVDGIQGELL